MTVFSATPPSPLCIPAPETLDVIPLAQFPRTTRLTLRVLWVAGIAAVAAWAGILQFELMSPESSGFRVFYSGVFLLPAALFILRAALVRKERAVWALFGAGALAFGAANGYYSVALQDLESPPYPSLSDALWLTCYAAFLGALMLLMRERLQKFRNSFWIDAAVGGLALASISAAILSAASACIAGMECE